MSIVVPVLVALLILLVILVSTLLLGLGFLGIGWVFGLIFPLSQYEATIVALGTGAFLAIVVLYIIRAVGAMEEKEEEEEEEYEPPYKPPTRTFRRKHTRR